MDAAQTTLIDALTMLRRLDAEALARRLDAIDEERRSLMTLLRMARRRDASRTQTTESEAAHAECDSGMDIKS